MPNSIDVLVVDTDAERRHLIEEAFRDNNSVRFSLPNDFSQVVEKLIRGGYKAYILYTRFLSPNGSDSIVPCMEIADRIQRQELSHSKIFMLGPTDDLDHAQRAGIDRLYYTGGAKQSSEYKPVSDLIRDLKDFLNHQNSIAK